MPPIAAILVDSIIEDEAEYSAEGEYPAWPTTRGRNQDAVTFRKTLESTSSRVG